MALALLAACATGAPEPTPAPTPAPAPMAFGPAAPMERCAVTAQGGIVVQGQQIVAWRRADDAAVAQAPSPHAPVFPTRGGLVYVEGGQLREVEGDRVVPLPGVARQPLRAAGRHGTDGLAVWAARDAGPVLLIDAATGGLLRLLGEQPAPVTAVGFAGRDRLATADRDGWVHIWGPTGARPDATLRPFGAQPIDVLAADGGLVAASRGGEVWLWSADPPGLVGWLTVGGDVVSLSVYEGTVALGVRGAGVLLWDARAARSTGGLALPEVRDVCLGGPSADPWAVVIDGGVAGGGSLVARDAWTAAPVTAVWTPAPADPVAALGTDAFVRLYQRVRCAQQRGDARAVVEVLQAHGVQDLPSWTAGTQSRLAADQMLLQRIATADSPPCP